MNGRTSVIGNLRRRSARVGRVVLALFVLASASVGAAPCFAMALSPASPGHHESASASAGHDHAGAAHQHSAPGEQPERSPQPSTPCPHCPFSMGMAADRATSSHALCSAADDVADGAKPSVASIAFKTILSVPVVELLPVDPRPSLAREKHRPPDGAIVAVALNLRHCVFLI